MFRHLLLIALTALLLAPALATAQTTEPVGTAATGDDEVSRAYDDLNSYFDVMTSVMAIGTIHPTEEAAARSLRTFPAVFAASIRAEGGADYEFSDPEEVEVTQFGDSTTAHIITFNMFGSFEGEYGLLAVQQGSWVQLLIGFGVGEIDIITELTGIAETTLPRWPSEEPVAVREDGLRTNGIWNMMPVPEDLPERFTVDPSFEEGPAATADEVMPVGTRTADEVATEEPATEATPVATEEPEAETEVTTPAEPTGTSRDLPLLPTEAPDDSVGDDIAPTVAPEEFKPEPTSVPEETATPEPAATTPLSVATPANLPARLATAFDLTVEIIVPLTSAETAEDGTCGGRGLLDGIAGGATLTLREAETGSPSVSTTIDAPGLVAYDTETQQEVCYFVASFTDVPPRAAYTLLAGESVLGRYTFEDVTAEDSLLIVLGDD